MWKIRRLVISLLSATNQKVALVLLSLPWVIKGLTSLDTQTEATCLVIQTHPL
jgi:hypothetical protein